MSGLKIGIRRIKPWDAAQALTDPNKLLDQLSLPRRKIYLTLGELTYECLRDGDLSLLVAEGPDRRGRKFIVGMGSIFFQRKISGWIAEIHDVVVNVRYRGLGFGKKIVACLIKEAKIFFPNSSKNRSNCH